LLAKNARNVSARTPRSLRKGASELGRGIALGYAANQIMGLFEDFSDEYCPHCDNHFVLEALTPKPSIQVEGEDARIDSRFDLLSLVNPWLHSPTDTPEGC
jgi:hypothetical protein